MRLAARFAARCLRRFHPFEVQACLTNRCNLRCAYCSCPAVHRDELTTQQWTEIIRRLRKVGTMRVKFQGGEPTVRTDLSRLCDEVRGREMIAAVITNGVIVASQPEILDHLDEIVVSLDSHIAKHHDWIRGSGSHRAATRALELAVERGLRAAANMVVTKVNLGDLEEMARFCSERGILFHAQPVYTGRVYYSDGVRDVALGHEEIRELHLRLAAWRREGHPILFSAGSYLRVAEWPDYDRLAVRSSGRSRCFAGKSYLHIEPDGDVYPCGMFTGHFEPVNIVTEGFEKSLDHLRDHHCGDCWITYLNERKALFGLRPAAVREALFGRRRG